MQTELDRNPKVILRKALNLKIFQDPETGLVSEEILDLLENDVPWLVNQIERLTEELARVKEKGDDDHARVVVNTDTLRKANELSRLIEKFQLEVMAKIAAQVGEDRVEVDIPVDQWTHVGPIREHWERIKAKAGEL